MTNVAHVEDYTLDSVTTGDGSHYVNSHTSSPQKLTGSSSALYEDDDAVYDDILKMGQTGPTNLKTGNPSIPMSFGNIGTWSGSDNVLKASEWNVVGVQLDGRDAMVAVRSLIKKIDQFFDRLMRLSIESDSKQAIVNGLRKETHEMKLQAEKRRASLQAEVEGREIKQKVDDIPRTGALAMMPTGRSQSPEYVKIYSRVMAALPPASSTNSIAAFINFFKHQLKEDPTWSHVVDTKTGTWTVSVSVFGTKLTEAQDSRKKAAREIVAREALRMLNENLEMVYYFIEQARL